MERRVRGNSHARCGAGENPAIASKDYLSLSSASTIVENYDYTGSRYACLPLSEVKSSPVASEMGDKAVFLGSGSNSKSVECYSALMNKTLLEPLTNTLSNLVATKMENKMFYIGKSADVINMNWYADLGSEDPQAHIPVASGGVYNFGGGEVAVPNNGISPYVKTIDVIRPVNGYIKYTGGTYHG